MKKIVILNCINFILFITLLAFSDGKDGLFLNLSCIFMLLTPVLLITLIIIAVRSKYYNKTSQTQLTNCNISQTHICKFCGCVYPIELTACPTCNNSPEKAKEIKKADNEWRQECNKKQNNILPELHEDECNKEQQEISLENYRKENQADYIAKLKMDYFEEYNNKPDFEHQKHCIFAEYEDDFDVHKDYNQNCCREYFIYNGSWSYFDFDDDEYSYRLITCKNKRFYTECYIDKITPKTKELLKFIKENPEKTEFLNVDLKNKSKILQTGGIITCLNCGYDYFSDNKKCPNCDISTKENLE